ncbi:hypothetical protein ACIPJK_35775 [Streptomyces roseus]|uniref:hypothetical protein n=1 Tax=Streptomyces roseus TaxID=66430 RepID=UPI003819A7B8
MTPSEAHELHAAMRKYGIPGVIAPVNPHDLAGAWMVVDEDGQNATFLARSRVAAERARQPERGFVFAR